MARVFMSFLGTNKYVTARYRFGDKCSGPTPFVQEALVELLCQDWGEEDRLIFFLTDEARARNWEDNGNFSEGLETCLRKQGITAQVVPVQVSEGRSEEQIRENFRTVVAQLHTEDHVIFDITHSFRSLPLLNLVALNYAKALRGVQVKGIYYGAFEVLGHPNAVKEMPEEERVAPVFDLTSYALLLDWSFAVDEFTRYGLAERLYELVRGEITPILRETKGRDTRASALRKMIEVLRTLTLSIYTSRCPSIETFTPQAITSLHGELLSPLDSLFERIEAKTRPFEAGSPWEKALSAVAWCIEHQLVQQGYTILLEAVISEMCRLLGSEDPYQNRKNRELVSSLLQVTAQKIPPEKWHGELGRRRHEVLSLQEDGGHAFIELARLYEKLDQIRNDINHCGCRAGGKGSSKLMEQLEEHYRSIKGAMASCKDRAFPKIFLDELELDDASQSCQ